MVMGDEVEDILFKIGARATNRVHFVLANHLGEREPELGGAHRACDRNQHFAAFLQVSGIALCGIFQRCRIKVPEMVRNEFGNSFHCAKTGHWFAPQFKGIFRSQAENRSSRENRTRPWLTKILLTLISRGEFNSRTLRR